MLLSEQATGNPHGPYGRPGSRGHHVGDPWFRFSTLLASAGQPSVTLQATDEYVFKSEAPLADL